MGDGYRRKRSSVLVMTSLLAATLLLAGAAFQGGCGGTDLTRQLLDLLEERRGSLSSLRFTCLTEDGDHAYREEVELVFPDRYRYRMYDLGQNPPRLITLSAQEENELYRVRAAGSASREGNPVEELLSGIPPLRNRGSYLSLYHLLGNGDYYASLASLIRAGVLRVEGLEEASGKRCYHLNSAAGQEPVTEMWVEGDQGLPVRKELSLKGGRRLVFSYQDMVINPGDYLEPFPPVTEAKGGKAAPAASDAGCRPLSLEEAESVLGFSPLVPEMPGFELVQAWWRDPAQSRAASEQSLKFPEGYRELYLVYRKGTLQLEMRQAPRLRDFGYYTTGLAALSEVYLTCRETLGEDTGNALYTASLDCQEMHLLAGDVEVTVTGDVRREEMEELARRLQAMAGSR